MVCHYKLFFVLLTCLLIFSSCYKSPTPAPKDTKWGNYNNKAWLIWKYQFPKQDSIPLTILHDSATLYKDSLVTWMYAKTDTMSIYIRARYNDPKKYPAGDAWCDIYINGKYFNYGAGSYSDGTIGKLNMPSWSVDKSSIKGIDNYHINVSHNQGYTINYYQSFIMPCRIVN